MLHEAIPMNGLIVLEPFATQIIDGTKECEYRSRPPPKKYINVPIYLLSGGYILGRIKIIGYGPLRKLPEYYWRIKVITKNKTRIKYNHPNGAQVWVKDIGKVQLTL